MIRSSHNRIGSRDLTGGISDALTNTYNMLNANDQQRIAEARQAAQDLQNKQLFDIKMAEVDRANKDREAQIQFGKGMLQPGVMDNILTDAISPELIKSMSFNDKEDEEYIAAKGDISKLKGSTRTKAELQNKLGDFTYTLPTTPEYQETAYQQAQRIANSIELTPGVLEELKKYQVADITAQKEAKKEGATYAAEAKELETKIAQLRTKQGAKADDIIGLGKEWGKKVNANGSSVKSMGYDELVKFVKEAGKTDSDKELRGMLKKVFDDTLLTKQQKEDAANNILVSAGAYDHQGFFDRGAKNVDIEAAKKANAEYGAMLDRTKNLTSKVESSEIEGIKGEIALLESRLAGTLAKANAYSVDRSTAAKNSVKARINELFGNKPTASSGGRSEQSAAKVNNTSKTDDSTKKPENVNTKKPYVEEPYTEDLLEKVKTPEEKEKVSMDINKLTELYKSKGGTGGSAGLMDDATIRKEADKLSRELNIPSKKIVETIRSKARQEILIEGRDKIIASRLEKANRDRLRNAPKIIMDKLKNDPEVQAAYAKSWRDEANRRGYIGTSARPSIEQFIKDNYLDKP